MSTNKSLRLCREAAVVKEYLDQCETSLRYCYGTIGRLVGRLPDNPHARRNYRASLANRERQEQTIEVLKRAIRKLQRGGEGQ
jgi:hypothetical protein